MSDNKLSFCFIYGAIIKAVICVETSPVVGTELEYIEADPLDRKTCVLKVSFALNL